MKRRILFVDDEVAVLEGLQNLLRRQRSRWDLVFAEGGPQALDALADGRCFDVIVSDLRMPGMDGAQLLQRVRDEHPGVARIVLSGHADRETVVRALPVAHQYLVKPCDGETLRVVIERTLALQALLGDESIRRVAGKLDKLPSAPRTYWELTRALARPGICAGDLGPIVEQDPGMAVKVLQLVNSEYFGLSQPIVSIRDAVRHLGADLLKGLALSTVAFAALEPEAMPEGSIERLQQESLSCARLARQFLVDPDRAEEAFTAALVRDIGQIVLALELPERFAATRKAVLAGAKALDVEREAFGATHAEVGAYLLGVWGVPFPIVEAVAHHHAPGRIEEGGREVLAAVHAADVWITGGELDRAFLERAGLGAELVRWRNIAERELGRLND